MVLHRSSMREQYAYRVPLGTLYTVEAEAAAERVACFLSAYSTNGLAHGGVDQHL
jgi:hypothetical protein